jgi:hypothetical protein
MLIKELHADVQRYLENDCYCPNEIYSSDGFFYQIFKGEDECTLVADWEKFVSAISGNQVLVFWKEEDKIVDAVRYDATENNVKLIKTIAGGEQKVDGYIDRFPDNSTEEDLKKILSIAHAVIIS